MAGVELPVAAASGPTVFLVSICFNFGAGLAWVKVAFAAEVLLVAAPLRRCGADGGLAGALGIASSVRMGLALGCFGGVAAAADGPLLATLVAVADALSAPGVLRALATGVETTNYNTKSNIHI